jgi:hypothetical protein
MTEPVLQETEARTPDLLSENPEKAMQEMMESIDDLRLLYVKENAALAEVNTLEYIGLQDEKLETLQKYQNYAKQFVDRKEEMLRVSPDVYEKLQGIHKEFSDITSENLNLIKRMQGGIKRLHSRIINAAKETAEKDGVNYGYEAKLRRHSNTMSIGVNESA